MPTIVMIARCDRRNIPGLRRVSYQEIPRIESQITSPVLSFPFQLCNALPRIRVKHVMFVVLFLFVLDYFGAFTHYFEQDFHKNFKYPLEGNIPHYVHQVRQGLRSDVSPVNTHNFSLVYNPKQKCRDHQDHDLKPKVLFLVKSALNHFKRRNAIRSSWGHERRFSDVVIRTVFLLGVGPSDDAEAVQVQSLIDIEANNFEDIVQANFIDAYFNNTLKTMSGIRWAVEHCPYARFYMFVDDDYFVSTKNVLRFVRNPLHYPDYIDEADEMIRQLARRLTESNTPNITDSALQIREIESILERQSATGHHSVDSRRYMAVIQSKYEQLKTVLNNEKRTDREEDTSLLQRKLLTKELPLDVKLFSGFVINSSPHRHKTSKWHISLEEYPYHVWPTYISAGSYLLSREALLELFYTSWFTKLFR